MENLLTAAAEILAMCVCIFFTNKQKFEKMEDAINKLAQQDILYGNQINALASAIFSLENKISNLESKWQNIQ